MLFCFRRKSLTGWQMSDLNGSSCWMIVHNFGAWKVIRGKNETKIKKKGKTCKWFDPIWTSASAPILKDRIVSYMMATNFAIDLWMPVERSAEGRMQQEGGRNQLSRQCVNACHSLPYCRQVWPIVTMRLNCTNNNHHCSNSASYYILYSPSSRSPQSSLRVDWGTYYYKRRMTTILPLWLYVESTNIISLRILPHPRMYMYMFQNEHDVAI